jgi:hypothetical protein
MRSELVRAAVVLNDAKERFEAAMKLARTYGESVVPDLLVWCSSPEARHRVNAGVVLRCRLGSNVVWPLCAILRSPSAQTRRVAAQEIGLLGDARSLAAVKDALEQERNPKARDALEQAWAALTDRYPHANGKSRSGLFLELAHECFHSGASAEGQDTVTRVWWWEDGLHSRSLSKKQCALILAEHNCKEAIRCDTHNVNARRLLAQVSDRKAAMQRDAGK